MEKKFSSCLKKVKTVFSALIGGDCCADCGWMCFFFMAVVADADKVLWCLGFGLSCFIYCPEK